MNPLIERYRNSHRHGRTYVVLSGLYVVTLVLAAIVALPENASGDLGGSWWVAGFASKLYSELWLLQIAMWFWTIGNTAGIIPKEIERKSYDLFRLLPLSSHQKALGLMVGANLPLLIFVGIDLAISTLVQPSSIISFGHHLQLQALTVSSGLLLNGVALLMNIWSPGRASGSSLMIRRSIMFLVLLVSIAPLMAIASMIGSPSQRMHLDLSHRVPFFGVSTPVSVVVFSVVWFFVIWTYGGTLRRLRCEDQAPFSRFGSLAFMASFCVLMLGLANRQDPFSAVHRWSSLIAPTWLVLFVAMNGAREQPGMGRPGASWSPLFNVATAAQLGLVASALSIVSAMILGVGAQAVLAVLSVGLVTYAFMTLVIEITSLLKPTFRHAVLVGGFVILVYALFPALVSATTHDDAYVFSGLDYFIVLLSGHDVLTSLGQLSIALVINGAYCVALALVMISLWVKSQRPRRS